MMMTSQHGLGSFKSIKLAEGKECPLRKGALDKLAFELGSSEA